MLIWQEVCLTNSVTSGSVFNGNLLEVNKIQQSFNLGHHATVYAMGLKLFTRSSRNIKAPRYRRCSFLINFLHSKKWLITLCVFQILDCLYWMVCIFIFDVVTVKTKNYHLPRLFCLIEDYSMRYITHIALVLFLIKG